MRRVVSLVLVLMILLGSLSALAASSGDVIIEEGAYNAGVMYLQKELSTLGFLTGDADGRYGPATARAVSLYRATRGLNADGGVDMAMINALMEDLDIRTLDIGSKGTAVYAVQQMLNTLGFLDSAPDGAFGQNTKSAALTYMQYAAQSAVDFMQKRQDERAATFGQDVTDDMPVVMDIRLISQETLPTDGAVTEDWLAFMFSGEPVYGPTLSKGDTGKDVKRLQRRLKALEYLATNADGAFGDHTYIALRYFQRRNGLTESGVLDARTQILLYSDDAVASDMYVAPYMAYVSTEKNQVRIMAWTGDGYKREAKVFTCSTGASKTPTIKGTFQAVGPISEWYYMPNSSVWVRYAFQIQGNYFFHSVLYNSKGAKSPTSSSVKALGRSVSHGCIRLAVEDIKWIYQNCTVGMTVVIQ